MVAETIEAFLTSPTLAGIASLMQLVVLVYMLRTLSAMVDALGTGHESNPQIPTIGQATADLHRWHAVEDPEYPFAKQWYGMGIGGLKTLLEQQIEDNKRLHDDVTAAVEEFRAAFESVEQRAQGG